MARQTGPDLRISHGIYHSKTREIARISLQIARSSLWMVTLENVYKTQPHFITTTTLVSRAQI